MSTATTLRAPRKCSQCRQEGCNKGKKTCPVNIAKTEEPLVVPVVILPVKKAKKRLCAEPVAEPVEEPVVEPVAEPVAEPVEEPVVEPVAEPVEEPVEEINWRIYTIEYKYPSIASNDTKGLSLDNRGIMNIENIYIENETDIAVISFENNVEISLGKKEDAGIKWDEDSLVVNNNIKQKFINACLNTDISDIKFDGTENDEDGNYTTKQNIKHLKNGHYGKYIKIDISGNNYGENLNAENKAKVLQEINKFINTDSDLSK